MLTPEVRIEVADALAAAERDRAPIPKVVETFPGMDVVDSYEVQLINIRRRHRWTGARSAFGGNNP